MNKKRIVQLCCAALVVSGIGLNIQNAIAGYGIGENSLSLVAKPGSGSNSNSNSNSLQIKWNNRHMTHYREYTDSLGFHRVETDSVIGVSHGCNDGKYDWCHMHPAMKCNVPL